MASELLDVNELVKLNELLIIELAAAPKPPPPLLPLAPDGFALCKPSTLTTSKQAFTIRSYFS